MRISGSLMSERGDRQAPLQAAGQRVHLVLGPVRELDELEQRRRPFPDDAAVQSEVPAVNQQVLPDGQLDVEGVVLRHDAEPGPDRRSIPDRVEAEDGQLPAGSAATRTDHRMVEDLPAPFGPRKPNASPR